MDLQSDLSNVQEGIIEIALPNEKNSCLIVDGQHRIKGFLSLYEELAKKSDKKNMEILENYKFNCSLLINYDLWEQARIFINVNFNQKPVDKTLYYDIFGEFSDELRDSQKSNLFVAHELGKFLNTSDISPIKGFVKNYSSKKGFVSQAFLMEIILKNFGARATWNSIIEDYKAGGNMYKKLPNVYIGYFNSVKKALKEYWPTGLEKADATVLCKTTGMASLVRLLGHIDKQLKLGFYPNINQHNLLELKIAEISEIFDEIFKTESFRKNTSFYFGENSKYSGSGSVSLQNELFYKMAEDLGIPAK
jgi:DGQHR domain-containing protein